MMKTRKTNAGARNGIKYMYCVTMETYWSFS